MSHLSSLNALNCVGKLRLFENNADADMYAYPTDLQPASINVQRFHFLFPASFVQSHYDRLG